MRPERLGASMPAFGPTAPAPAVERVPAMHQYVLCLLRRAPSRPPIPEEEAERIQTAHLAHLDRLRRAGEAIVYGPIEEDADLRGIVVYRDGPIDRVRPLADADPAVAHGRLVAELWTWSAADGLRLGPPLAPAPPDDPE